MRQLLVGGVDEQLRKGVSRSRRGKTRDARIAGMSGRRTALDLDGGTNGMS
jgi:hypothetical protein